MNGKYLIKAVKKYQENTGNVFITVDGLIRAIRRAEIEEADDAARIKREEFYVNERMGYKKGIDTGIQQIP